MAIPIIIVSHKRAGRVTTHKIVANTKICVPESQAEDYAKFHPEKDIIVHPNTVIGSVAKRQWTFEYSPDVFMLDDDVTGFHRIYRASGAHGGRGVGASPTRIYDLIQLCGDTARQMGAFLFGFGSHAHPMTHNQFRPFKLGGYTPSGALGMLSETSRGRSKLWFPAETRLPVEDYWICLLNAYYHRYAWYDCRFAFGFKETYVGAGGCAEFRIGDTERGATQYLVKHFGDAVQAKVHTGGATTHTRNRWQRKIVLPYRV